MASRLGRVEPPLEVQRLLQHDVQRVHAAERPTGSSSGGSRATVDDQHVAHHLADPGAPARAAAAAASLAHSPEPWRAQTAHAATSGDDLDELAHLARGEHLVDEILHLLLAPVVEQGAHLDLAQRAAGAGPRPRPGRLGPREDLAPVAAAAEVGDDRPRRAPRPRSDRPACRSTSTASSRKPSSASIRPYSPEQAGHLAGHLPRAAGARGTPGTAGGSAGPRARRWRAGAGGRARRAAPAAPRGGSRESRGPASRCRAPRVRSRAARGCRAAGPRGSLRRGRRRAGPRPAGRPEDPSGRAAPRTRCPPPSRRSPSRRPRRRRAAGGPPAGRASRRDRTRGRRRTRR